MFLSGLSFGMDGHQIGQSSRSQCFGLVAENPAWLIKVSTGFCTPFQGSIELHVSIHIYIYPEVVPIVLYATAIGNYKLGCRAYSRVCAAMRGSKCG